MTEHYSELEYELLELRKRAQTAAEAGEFEVVVREDSLVWSWGIGSIDGINIVTD